MAVGLVVLKLQFFPGLDILQIWQIFKIRIYLLGSISATFLKGLIWDILVSAYCVSKAVPKTTQLQHTPAPQPSKSFKYLWFLFGAGTAHAENE